MHFFAQTCTEESLKSLEPSNENSRSALVVDFGVREDASELDIEETCQILNELFHDWVVSITPCMVGSYAFNLCCSYLSSIRCWMTLRPNLLAMDWSKAPCLRI